MSTNSSPYTQSLHVKPCCIRCAQLYKAYPDLECNPEYREDDPNKGLTRREAIGCKNCRTRKLKCHKVPVMHNRKLEALQGAARIVLNIQHQGQIPVAAFYDLKSAQEDFSRVCPVKRINVPKEIREDIENPESSSFRSGRG